ncbi:MAG: hypothetical protein J6A02_01975 [Prevotella sp.]|nr:hypothetical protein [Prevotella sp.]MBQ2951332.1 hypothetical protein [Prevotella sp.]
MKEYIKPSVMIVEVCTESLLTTFSSDGEIGGPVGAKEHDGIFDPYEDSTVGQSSVWDE